MKWIKRYESKKEFSVPKIILKLNEIFNNNNFKLYIVGGAIRDFLKGETPKDYDLSTDAMPEDVIKMLEPHFRVQLQGEAFGVTVVFPPEMPEGIEIATFRVDKTKGRKPVVELGVSIEDDVLRRDLTINAMFYDLETREIIDLVGGKEDLKNNIIRMVGDPKMRIEEDPLRILRILRFATRYSSKIDQKTKRAIKSENDISEISFERIWDRDNGEFFKAFKQSENFIDYIQYLIEFGLIEQILPGLKFKKDIFNSQNIEIILAQLIGDNDPKMVKKVFNKVTIPTDISKVVKFLIELKDFTKERVMDFYKDKKRFSISEDLIEEYISLLGLKGDVEFFTKFTPEITAKDVMKEFNIKPGPELGNKLKKVNIEEFEKLLKINK